MTGGYLTLDFSNVEFKQGDSITSFTLGYKKGIYNYIKKTGKPIYIIFSPSVMKALFDYYDSNPGKQTVVNKCVYFLQPIFDRDSDLVTSRFFLVSSENSEVGGIGLSYLATESLLLIFNPDDTISINEL